MLQWNILQYLTKILRQYFNCNERLEISLTCFRSILCYVGNYKITINKQIAKIKVIIRNNHSENQIAHFFITKSESEVKLFRFARFNGAKNRSTAWIFENQTFWSKIWIQHLKPDSREADFLHPREYPYGKSSTFILHTKQSAGPVHELAFQWGRRESNQLQIQEFTNKFE